MNASDACLKPIFVLKTLQLDEFYGFSCFFSACVCKSGMASVKARSLFGKTIFEMRSMMSIL